MDKENVVELKLEEENELFFKVSVQGASSKPSAFRLVCEDSNVTLCFKGSPDDEGNICFKVPPMEKYLLPETVYDCAVEVLVEGRFFRPVQFPVKFTADVKCVVENIQVRQHTKEESISVVARPSGPVVKKMPVAPSPSLSTFDIKPKQQTLREKVDSRRKSGTGIDDHVMAEVVARLNAKDSGNKNNT